MLPTLKEVLRDQAFDLSPEDQFWLAVAIAQNIGYELIAEGKIEHHLSMEDRIERLECAVRDLNPGLRI